MMFPTPPGVAYSVPQIRTAYDWSSSYQGKGMTIAIIDQGSSGTEQTDMYCFSKAYKLPYGALTVVQPFGTAAVDPGWGLEISLDMEWAHAIAPAAKILLIEVPITAYSDVTGTFTNMIDDAVPYAVSHGANVISMSWGYPESYIASCSSEQSESAVFANAANAGVTLVAAAGDSGAFADVYHPNTLTPLYPATDPNVISVGGTNLALNSGNHIQSETVWNDLSTGWGATGGGESACFGVPAYQRGDAWSAPVAMGTVVNGQLVLSSPTGRATPDVGYVADPFTAVWVDDSGTGNPCASALGPNYNGWIWCPVGGTSAGSPQWAGIFADIKAAYSVSVAVDASGDSTGSMAPGNLLTWSLSPPTPPSLATVSCAAVGTGISLLAAYGGAPMSLAVSRQVNSLYVAMFYLNDPAARTQNIVVKLNAAGGTTQVECSATTWTGTAGVDLGIANTNYEFGSTQLSVSIAPAYTVPSNEVFFSALSKYEWGAGTTLSVAGVGATPSIVDSNTNSGSGSGYGCQFVPGSSDYDCIASAQLPTGGTSMTYSWAYYGAYAVVAGFGIKAGLSMFDYLYDSTAFNYPIWHDVPWGSGNNGFWYAINGWDACTGFGTPDIAQFITQYPNYATV